jgi:hypothetical protein
VKAQIARYRAITKPMVLDKENTKKQQIHHNPQYRQVGRGTINVAKSKYKHVNTSYCVAKLMPLDLSEYCSCLARPFLHWNSVLLLPGIYTAARTAIG